MTLPASFPMSMSQIATELGLSLPLSISDPWVLALAGKSALPVSFSDLLGQTARPNFNATPSSDGTFMQFSAPFFRGVANQFSMAVNVLLPVALGFSTAPNWSGKIIIRNNSTGNAITLTKHDAVTWTGNGDIMRGGVNDNWTLSPSN